MDGTLPTAKSACDPDERDKLRELSWQRGLCGLANDTKWDELISAMRERPVWCPRYRFQCIDGPPSDWDGEWFYHLPFPLISVEWLDLLYLQKVLVHRLPFREEIVDHSGWIEVLLQSIGLDYRKGEKMIRIFGYSPRNMNLFDD